MKRVLVTNTAWLAGERALRFGSSVLVMAVIARHLGAAEFGALNYAASCLALMTPLLTMGMNRTLVREFVTDRGGSAALIVSVVRARIALALILLGILLAGLLLADDMPSLLATLIVVTACGLLLQAFEPLDLWYQAQRRNRVPVLVKTGSLLAVSVFKLALVYAGAPVVAFAWAGVLELGMNAAGLAFCMRFDAPGGGRIVPHSITRLLRECWPEVVAGAGLALCLRLDQFVLERTHGIAAVGVYAAGVRLSDAWYFVPAAVVTSYYPLLVAARAEDPARYAQTLQQMFLVVGVICLAIITATVAFADLLVRLVYGAEFSAAVPVLRIHVLSLLAMGFGLASGAWIFAEARARLSMWRTLFGVAVGIIANALLVAAFGMVGAACATVLSLYAAFYVFDTIVPSTRPIFLLKSRALDPRNALQLLQALARDARGKLAARRPAAPD